MISFKNFRAKINEAADYSGLSIDQLKQKFSSDVEQYEKDGHFENDKIETIFMQWGISNGEIRTDDYAEFEEFMANVIDEDFSIDEKKMSAAAKKKAAKWRKSPAGKAALKKYKKKYSKSSYKVDKKRSKAMKKSRKKSGIRSQYEDEFEPHIMYDPKTGKAYKANTIDDHLRMKELGYTHDKPS